MLDKNETRLRVLVVDDNTDAAESLNMVLGMYGHEVRVAHTGHDAVRMAAEWPPEVVLLDIGLPGLDGYQVAGALRQAPATARATIVAMTGFGQASDRERSMAAGFNAHMVKPVDPDAVAELLRQAAKRSQ